MWRVNEGSGKNSADTQNKYTELPNSPIEFEQTGEDRALFHDKNEDNYKHYIDLHRANRRSHNKR